MAAICQFVEVQLHRELRDSAEQAPGGEVANKDERIYRRRFLPI